MSNGLNSLLNAATASSDCSYDYKICGTAIYGGSASVNNYDCGKEVIVDVMMCNLKELLDDYLYDRLTKEHLRSQLREVANETEMLRLVDQGYQWASILDARTGVTEYYVFSFAIDDGPSQYWEDILNK